MPARDLGVYIHVPFCRVRCGYCDFNTYAPSEVGGATREGYVESALREMALAGRVMEGDGRAASTVFFGGGTPTMLDAAALSSLLEGVRTRGTSRASRSLGVREILSGIRRNRS